MTVYVDDMRRPARPAGYRGRGTPRWSHLMADTHDELVSFAQHLGLSSTWLQHPRKPTEHFDVTDTVRREALRHGAVPIRYGRQGGLLIAAKAARARGDLKGAAEYDEQFRSATDSSQLLLPLDSPPTPQQGG